MKKLGSFIWKIIRYGTIIFFASSLFFVVIYRWVNPPITPLMIIRVFEQLTTGEKVSLKKEWVPSGEISDHAKQAVVAAEDNLFLEHNGFDFEAIEKAKAYNERKKGKKVRGASTISQQTAKNVFLWPERSWVRKGLEVYFTFLIEQLWSKPRILEVYLNVIETGKGIYGVEQASETYFNKPAAKLSAGEAAFIAAILPNPRKWDPSHPTSYLIKRQQWILRNMNNLGQLDFN